MPVNLDDCSTLRPTLAVPGGQDPDWGPAEVGQRDHGGPPPCSGCGGGGAAPAAARRPG